ncbi:glycine betaine ABC transporter substrate-binding protein [Sinorhizobium meliloti]|uniref:glycine betaine ABC transporter substrate-binding protein n=1 Tax=Rhizobium meliloti TaxID=382 RepID=UPI000FD8FFE7|nr:glycine betaine ABC transporter substrate-binding protein [Sinorhizobium meliloti]RVI99545.1 glycine betaine ABC transporter substrate-binding protein [Sinorhizobium meliloti]
MRNIIKLFTAAALTLMSVASAQAQEKLIKMGSMPWEDLLPISMVTKKFLEKQGYKVEITQFQEWGIAFAALSKGDVDILASQINYITPEYWAKNKNRLEKVSTLSHGLFQGLVVPSDAPIDSVDQLNDYADKVGGKIVGIEPGTGLMAQVEDAIKAYDLKYQVIDGSTAAMTAQLQSSLERKEPIVTMLWEPSWMALKFDVKFLKDPKGVFPPPQTYYWIARKGFSAEDAHRRESLASVFVPIDDITGMNAEINDGKTMEQAVDNWWDKHADLIEKWSVMSD